ncbi:tetratricopeptide repeat protein [Spirulina sp. 06S082]|uniref:tetratricopeptide repeat protein n=1 Tax=Spirulina sp. 06S082 TaxID=3110248 RepID=UPI002B20EBCD|nr:tetratricopeptide repeat protein [Spirulina sp. 06S082]MEA5471622.1 tetratricopeptide repeat protein [Spirulina sp. 06S082]
MKEQLPVIYISFLLVLLAGTAIFLFQQVFRTRRLENQLEKLQKKLKGGEGTSKDYYELGSIYLKKKLYVQSSQVFQKGLKSASKEEIEPENLALIYNALGFSYFSREQYDLAIRNYKEALKLNPEYAIANNNLANVYEKKTMDAKALETYKETLQYAPANKTAQRRVEALQKRFATPQ